MKSILRITLFAAVLTLGLAGCRSSKNAPVAEEPAKPSIVEKSEWDNAVFPVRVNVIQPMNFTLNGTATLVREQYIFVSLRMLGFEVAQLYVTPEEMDLVTKQPQKMWVQEAIGNRLKAQNLSITTLQNALLGVRSAQLKLPETLQCGGTSEVPLFRLQTNMKNLQIDIMLECLLEDMHLNIARPTTFTPPTGINKITIKKAASSLGK